MSCGVTNKSLNVLNVLMALLDYSLQIFKIIVRLLRKRVVLALIFTLSFTYCLLSLIRDRNIVSFDDNDNTGHLYDYETNVDIDKLNIIPERHSNNNSVDVRSPTLTDQSIKLDRNTCRNSIQGKVLIADDRGYVCHRKHVRVTGCCDESADNTRHYWCDTCQDHGCCAIYEYCISCCMEPNKKPLLTRIVGSKTSETFNVLMASITDHFELCLTKCRTSSASVQHENSYRDPKAKHCYGESNEKLI